MKNKFNTTVEVEVRRLAEEIMSEGQYKQFEEDYVKLTCKVEWSIDFELREYGVKSVTLSVPDQTLCIDGFSDSSYIELDLKDVSVESDSIDLIKNSMLPKALCLDTKTLLF